MKSILFENLNVAVISNNVSVMKLRIDMEFINTYFPTNTSVQKMNNYNKGIINHIAEISRGSEDVINIPQFTNPNLTLIIINKKVNEEIIENGLDNCSFTTIKK